MLPQQLWSQSDVYRAMIHIYMNLQRDNYLHSLFFTICSHLPTFLCSLRFSLTLSLSLCHLAVSTCSTFLDKPLDVLWMWIWTSDSWQSLGRCLCLFVHVWVCEKGLSELRVVSAFASKCTFDKTHKVLRANLWCTHRCSDYKC